MVTSRRHAGLVAFLARQPSLKWEDLDFSHPILSGSTMGELQAAQEELARRSNDELCAQFVHWMGSADHFSVGAQTSSDWLPLPKLRYSRFSHRTHMNQRSAFVWSPADLWMVQFIQAGNVRGRKNLHYAVYSEVSREPADYFVYNEQAAVTQGRITVSPTAAARLPSVRGLNAALNIDLAALMDSLPMTPILATDNDFPLHQYIRTNFLV